jgi:cytoskeletal protein CcmA (bactofilin family)
VFGDVSFGNLLTVDGNILAKRNATIHGNLYVTGGDVSFNKKLTVFGDVSFGNLLTVDGNILAKRNATIDGNLYVTGGDVSFNKKLTVFGDVSFGNLLTVDGNILAKRNATIHGNLYVTGGDVSFNGNLTVLKDVSFGNNVFMTKLPKYIGSDEITAGTDGNTFITKRYADSAYSTSTINTNLTVTGDLTVTGNVTANAFYATSDKRLKTDIQLMPSQWKNIKLLQPCEYKWLETHKEDYGFIAQDVYNVYPSMKPAFHYPKSSTSTMDDPIDIFGDPLYYSIDYSKMTALLCKGLQETMEIVETQHRDIETLKQEIADMKKQFL